jgi:hypothetical protein
VENRVARQQQRIFLNFRRPFWSRIGARAGQRYSLKISTVVIRRRNAALVPGETRFACGSVDSRLERSPPANQSTGFVWCGLTFISLKITNSPGANLDARGAFAKRKSRPGMVAINPHRPAAFIDKHRADWDKLGSRYCGRAGCCDLPPLKFSGSQEHESRLSLPMRPNLILPTFLASQTIV